MSSFTDQIMTFNPHISQLPVEDMTKVGMIKQGQYDAGVEKVNQYKADIQSLDVIHPLQKEYIQSSLGNLNEQLKKVAGADADFSNQQLVGQIGGMASKIANDPIVKNAVASTADIRKNYANMDDAKKNGKSSPSNEYVFQNSVNEFMNSGDVNSTYKGGYTPYNEKTRPKVFEAIKGLVPNEVIQDIARDPNFMGKDGKMHIGALLDAMKRHKVTSLDEGKIRTAIGAVLDANDYNQLSIDGQYYLQGHDVPQLGQTAINQYKNQVNNANAQLKDLQGQLSITSDIQTQAELNSRIAYYKNLIGDHKKGVKGLLDQQLESDLVSIQNDPKGARGKLYTNNFIDEVSNAMAYKKVSDTIESSPEKENYWKTMSYNLSVANAAETRNQHAIENRRADRKEERELIEFNTKYGTKPGDYVNAGDPTTEHQESLKYWASYNADLDGVNKGILSQLSPGTPLGGGPDAAAALNKIRAYQKGEPAGNPSNSEEKALMDKYTKNEQLLSNNKLLYETKNKEARKEIAGGENEEQVVKNALAQHRPLVINGVTYTPREIYDYLDKEQSVQDVQGPNTKKVYTIASGGLKGKEKDLFNYMRNRYEGNGSSGNSVIDAYVASIEKLKGDHKVIEDQVTKATADKMSTYTGVFRPEQASIPFKDNQTQENFDKSLINIASADLEKKTSGLNYDPATAVKWLGEKKEGNIDITTSSYRAGGKQFIKIINTKDPGHPQVVPVTNDWVANNTALGYGYLNKNIELAQALQAGGGNTNLTGKPEDSYFKPGEFGSMDQFGRRSVTLPIIGGDFKQAPSGAVFATIYLKQNNGEPLQYKIPYPVNPEAFVSHDLPALTNESLLEMLRKTYPNIDQLIKK